MSLTLEQREELQAQEKALAAWVTGYRKEITRRLARPGPQPETLQLMDLALQKSRTLNAIRWCLFVDRYPNFN